MQFLSSSRRRRVLIATLLLAAGGYASYQLYCSPSFERRRRRVLRIIKSACFLGETLTHSSESLAILSADLKAFLLSDHDTVPQSFRQSFKIAQCPEFQGAISVLSAALTRGLLRGFDGKPRRKGKLHRRASTSDVPRPDGSRTGGTHRGMNSTSLVQSVKRSRFDTPDTGEDGTCREIREVCLSSVPRSGSATDCDGEGIHCDQLHPVDVNIPETKGLGTPHASYRGRMKESPTKDLPERLLAKLFSEPGVDFASAVVGSAAQSVVSTLLSGVSSHGQPSGGPPDDQLSMLQSRRSTVESQFVDMFCTEQCRGLIMECIQSFVSTAVTVYIDKTKDVNFYDDMVAGITNPCHRDPMKDMLTSVCNGVVETLVRTGHDVMFEKKQSQPASVTKCPESQPGHGVYQGVDAVVICTNSDLNGVKEVAHQGCTTPSSLESMQPVEMGEHCSGTAPSVREKTKENITGMQSFMDGLFKTLAIPSNRRLVLDVAGTITAEAVKSFIETVISTIKSQFHSTVHCNLMKGNISVSNQACSPSCPLKAKSKNVAVIAIIIASICLAICLHVTGFHIIERDKLHAH